MGEPHLVCLSLLLQPYQACLLHLRWLVRWEVSGHTAAVLKRAASRICSKQLAASSRCSHFAFSPSVSIKWCYHTVVLRA